MNDNIESLKRIIEIKIEEDNFDYARKLCEETLDRIENEEIKQLLVYIVEYKHVDGFIDTNLQTLKQKFKGNFYKYKESKIDKEYSNMVETEYLADIALGSNDNDNYHDEEKL